ncbi:MAG: glycine cleavage T C-terminal barrel domain-containing protein, partial [Pseudomonadota bacterium]
AGSDFDYSTTPYDVGLGIFVDEDKGEFIGQQALKTAAQETRQSGLLCEAEPHIGAEITFDGKSIGKVTAGAMSPFLKQGVGIGLLDQSGYAEGSRVEVGCIDGRMYPGTLASLPLYDKAGEIQRGVKVDIPERDV